MKKDLDVLAAKAMVGMSLIEIAGVLLRKTDELLAMVELAQRLDRQDMAQLERKLARTKKR